MQWAKKQSGFTIVELLVVIVVIAILASITIVSYNGIQNRAKEAALQSSLRSAANKLLAASLAANDTFPSAANFTSVTGLSNDSTTTYSYLPSTDLKNYCVSATSTSNPSLSYATTNQSTFIQGQCVTNLVLNPSFELGATGWSYNSASGSTTSTDWAATGEYSLRVIPSLATADSFARIGNQTNMLGMTHGETYTVTATSRLGSVQSGTLDNRARRIVAYSWTGSTAGALNNSDPIPNATGATVQSTTFTIPAGVTGVEIRLYSGGTNSANNSVYWDNVMITKGSTKLQYGDGTSQGWFWDGAPHNSVSIGPAKAV